MLPRGFSVSNRTNQLNNLQPVAFLTVRVMADIITISTRIARCAIIHNISQNALKFNCFSVFVYEHSTLYSIGFNGPDAS